MSFVKANLVLFELDADLQKVLSKCTNERSALVVVFRVGTGARSNALSVLRSVKEDLVKICDKQKNSPVVLFDLFVDTRVKPGDEPAKAYLLLRCRLFIGNASVKEIDSVLKVSFGEALLQYAVPCRKSLLGYIVPAKPDNKAEFVFCLEEGLRVSDAVSICKLEGFKTFADEKKAERRASTFKVPSRAEAEKLSKFVYGFAEKLCPPMFAKWREQGFPDVLEDEQEKDIAQGQPIRGLGEFGAKIGNIDPSLPEGQKRIKAFARFCQVKAQDLGQQATFLEQLADDKASSTEVLRKSGLTINDFEASDAGSKARTVHHFAGELIKDMLATHDKLWDRL